MSTVKRETPVHEFPKLVQARAGISAKSQFFFNRELSLLEVHARVLEEALDDSNPLLERLKFLSIFSSNNATVLALHTQPQQSGQIRKIELS